MPTYRTPDRVQLNYRESGEGQPTLILIHGWACRLDDWQSVASALSRHYKVLRLDLRGHGKSDAPADGYSMRQLADDTAALARSRRIRSAVVVGHSMGSTVGLEMARRHPRLVSGLIMVDGGIEQHSTVRDLKQNALWRSMTEEPFDVAFPEFYANFFPDPREAALAERVIAEAAQTPEHVVLASLRALLTTNIPAIAKQVRQPVLYVDGGHNLRPAEAVHRILPRASYAQAALSGHFIHLEVPDQLTAMIRRFVERL